MILHVAILFIFTSLIILHLYKSLLKPTLIEGATFNAADDSKYTDPGLDKNPLYLAQLNASNITFLKGRIDDITKLREEVNDLSGTVHANAVGITQVNKHLGNLSAGLGGRKPDSKAPIPKATGLF